MGFISYLKTDRGKINGFSAILAGFSAMFCFMGYELIRSSSESIFLSYFSALDKVYALALTPFFLIFLIYLYGFSLSKIGSKKTMIIYFFLVISVELLFYSNLHYKKPMISFFLLIFKEGYVVVISELYWSYINSILKSEEAKIINGPVAGLGALGSLMGGYFVSKLAKALSTEKMILYSAFTLIPAVFILIRAYNISGEPRANKDEEGGKKGHIHLSILLENRTVLFIAFIVFLAQIVSTLSDINFTYHLQNSISDKDIRTAYLGSFWNRVNIISFSMQFLITPLVLKRFKIKYVLIFIPLLHLFTSLYSFIFPSLFSAGLVFMIFKSMDYSIYKASKEILYIPFSYDTKYRVKQIVDSFTYRFSKGFISILMSVLNIVSFSYFKIIIPFIMLVSLIWSYIASRIETKE